MRISNYTLKNLFNPIITKRESEILILLPDLSNNLTKSFEFHIHSITFEDFKNKPIDPFNPFSTKRVSDNFNDITRSVGGWGGG